MDQDDPEKRIAELERQLAESRAASDQPTAVPMEPTESDAASMLPPSQWSHPPAPSYPYPAAPPPGWVSGKPAWRGTRGRFFIGIAVVLLVMVAYGLLGQHFSSNSGTTSTMDTVSRGGNMTFTGSNETNVLTCDGGDISVTGGSSTVVIIGHCATVTVAGHNNRVRIDSVGTMRVDGTSNNVKIDSADTINASGSDNTVAYYSGTPNIADTGSSNHIHQGFGG
ncbi:MAG: DUF3060 domain-containing protein [Mycobacterium sp.]|uniref:DUF3060 domain-containing protein n=1 Tax=Mycobacterium sp. TaxID=1785 RepID=UPI003F958312